MNRPKGYYELSSKAKKLMDNFLAKNPPLGWRKYHGLPWRVYHALFKAGYCKPPSREPLSPRWGYSDAEIRSLCPEPDREKILKAMEDGTMIKSSQLWIASLVTIANWLYPSEEEE